MSFMVLLAPARAAGAGPIAQPVHLWRGAAHSPPALPNAQDAGRNTPPPLLGEDALGVSQPTRGAPTWMTGPTRKRVCTRRGRRPDGHMQGIAKPRPAVGTTGRGVVSKEVQAFLWTAPPVTFLSACAVLVHSFMACAPGRSM
jgi:hypothetical protein